MTCFYFFIFAIVTHALTDEIDHKKGARTLYDLWHFMRNWTGVNVFLIGISYNGLGDYPWWVYLLAFGGAMILWNIVYRLASITNFQELDDELILPLPFAILGFGKKSGKTVFEWLKEKF